MQAHSLSPYLLRCFNKDLNGPREQRYSNLNNIGAHDLYDLLKQFISVNIDSYTIIEDSNQVYRFSDVECKAKTREITAWFNVGHYGMKTEIINVDTGHVDFEKTQKNAEIIKHYVHFFIPEDANEAMAFMHSYRSQGVKTLFHTLFSAYFQTNTQLFLQMNPLAYDKALHAWLDAEAKEIKLTKFKGASDISDAVGQLGHCEQEIVIKAPRNSQLGRLREYINTDSEKFKAVEIIGEYGEQVKTVVELDGKSRTFRIGREQSSPLCEIEFDDSIDSIDGVPELSSLTKWVRVVINEYIVTLYPGRNLKV